MELTENYLEILEELVGCAEALGPYRDDVVVTGGLVPFLYRFRPGFQTPNQPALLTHDLDLTVPNPLPLRDDERMRDRLQSGGFVIVPSRGTRRDTPPKHFFQQRTRGTEDVAPIHGELLTPLVGSRTDRDGNPKSPFEVQEGLNAEALRYLDLLLWNPISFDLGSLGELDRSSELDVQIPRPGAYLIQKLLCSEERESDEKRHKDLAYCYDLATLTHGDWAEMQAEIAELAAEKTVWSKWIDQAGDIIQDAFLADDASGAVLVSRVYGDESVRETTVDRVMEQFIESMWTD
jgi:hypothetical protein